MSYFLRAFCTAGEPPPPGRIVDWADEQDVDLEVEGTWPQVELVLEPGQAPILVEATTDEELAEEVAEFVEEVEDAAASPARERVLAHLRATRMVVAAQIPGDIEDEDWDTVTFFLAYFIEECGGLAQADGEGFYDGGTLVVELP